jgi:hypothetical protein
MSWYDEDYQKRAAITVHEGTATATADVDITIPSDWDDFWDAIDSSGNELRITYADGYTLVPGYDVDKPGGGAFSKANRTGRLRIDAATFPNVGNTLVLFWVYYDTVSTQGDGSAAVTMASIKDGYIELGKPATDKHTSQRHPPGLSRPRRIVSKTAGETAVVSVDLARVLEQRETPFAGRRAHEEPWAVLHAALEQDGTTSATATIFPTNGAGSRYIETKGETGAERSLWLKVPIAAGTNGDNYTVSLIVRTLQPGGTAFYRQINDRIGVRVIDAVEEAT